MSVKSSIDFRRIVQAELGGARNTSGKAWNFKCPFHQEQTGASLAVYEDGWRCFGKCINTPTEYGDAIDWFRIRHKMTFKQACEALQVNPDEFLRDRQERHGEMPRPEATPPSREWMVVANPAVEMAERELWKNKEALAYLLDVRGFTLDTIREARFGYNPNWLQLDFHDPHTGKRAKVPPGIVIPWFIGGQLWAIKVRTPVGNLAATLKKPQLKFFNPKTGAWEPAPKYLGVAGGSARGCYNVDALTVGCIALIVEGEFDARIAQQCCPWLRAVTLGSATYRLPARWRDKLLNASYRLLCLDNDKAGSGAKENLLKELPDANNIEMLEGIKDLSDLNLTSPGAVHSLLATGGYVR